MNNQPVSKHLENDIGTFRRIRRAIGYLAICLPVVLVILSLVPFFNTPVQSSISQYYYTNLREMLTGVLCAVGLFLIRYQGTDNPSFWKKDGVLTNIAGYMAFGIAFFPTNPGHGAIKAYTLISSDIEILGHIHYGFAAIFFIILAVISINVFTIGQKMNESIPVSMINENHIYMICGYLMLFFIVLVPVFSALKIFKYSTLLFESLALFLFGISWLIKGRALGDKGKVGERIYRESN